MLRTSLTKDRKVEQKFFHLYQMVQEREPHLTNEAKIVQYHAVLRYFMKFLQFRDKNSQQIYSVLYEIDKKLGDVYYDIGTKTQDKTKYFFAIEYYNQAFVYAKETVEKQNILFILKDIYYYLGDEKAMIKVEDAWAESHEKKDRFSVYMLLAQNTDSPKSKALFLSKALDDVMDQEESFYAKYQDTLDVCSQLAVLYELLGEKEKEKRVKKLRENALKLLN